MNRYTDADAKIELYGNGGAKTIRGLGGFYNTLINSLEHDPETLLEIGVGAGHSHLTWSEALPNTTVVGIELSSPSLLQCEDRALSILQYTNAIDGIDNFHGNKMPMKATKNINIYYNRDAYDPAVAQEFTETYGQLPVIINDGWTIHTVHNLFLDSWRDKITDNGCLIQEKLGRYGNLGVNTSSIQKALDKGWLVYDMREHGEFHVNNGGIVAVWSNNKTKYENIFSDFKRVYQANEDLSDIAVPMDSYNENISCS